MRPPKTTTYSTEVQQHHPQGPASIDWHRAVASVIAAHRRQSPFFANSGLKRSDQNRICAFGHKLLEFIAAVQVPLQRLAGLGVGDIVVTVDDHDPKAVAELMLDRIDERRQQTR